METEFWDIIEGWKENMEESNMEVKDVTSPTDKHNLSTKHMHTSNDHYTMI